MEHACHKCGTGVEDGIPFCKHCGAPQIRVPGIEPAATASPILSDTEATLPSLPAALPVIPSTGVQWSHALPAAALAGAFSLFALVIPLAVFGPAFLAGGALSVILYRRHAKDRIPSPADGAQIGAASGGFGFLFLTILVVAKLVYSPDELRQPMLERIAQAGHSYDAQRLQQMQEFIKSPQGLAILVGFGLLMLFVIFVAGSSIGGALYATWLRKRSLS